MESVNKDPLHTKTAAFNPYRAGIGMVIRRMRWDFDYRAWVSRKRLRLIKDSHAGEKCVILCNGPSLLRVDFGSLQRSGVYTFGLNKINLLFEETNFRPHSIVAVNRHVIEQNTEFFNATHLPLFLSWIGRREVGFRRNISFIHTDAGRDFVRDCSVTVPQGGTVTHVALQLAFHMGFRRVALVGCDHNFAISGPPNMAVVSGERDESHFHPDYFAGGKIWQLPDLPKSEYSYSVADQTYRAFGGEVVNCTDGGYLEVFRRESLRVFLND